MEWGDGTRATFETVTCANGAYTLTATHTYVKGGRYPIVVTYEGGERSEAYADIAPAFTLTVERSGPELESQEPARVSRSIDQT